MNESNLQDVYTLQIRRQTNNHNPSPYCEACKNGFVHVNSLQVRQFTGSGKLPGVCKFCNEAFLRICRLQIRHLTHSDAHPHVCIHCNKSFTHAGNIKKHMLMHEKDAAKVAESNGAEGESSHSLAVLPARGKLQPPFICEHCGRQFIKYGSFIKHCNKHTEDKIPGIYDGKVDENSEERPNIANESNAENSETNDIVEPTNDIVESSSNHADKQDTETLAIEDNNEANITKPFRCDLCSKSFLKQGFLLRHCQTHVMDSFKCPVCQKTFKKKPLLSSHMRIHKHVCKMCKQSFAAPEDLEVHLQNHVHSQTLRIAARRVMNHYCSVCNRGFNSLGNLKKHFIQHTGDEENAGYKCPHCTKSFVRKIVFNKHLRKHGHKRKILICKVCSKHFKYPRTFKKHMSMHGLTPVEINNIQK